MPIAGIAQCSENGHSEPTLPTVLSPVQSYVCPGYTTPRPGEPTFLVGMSLFVLLNAPGDDSRLHLGHCQEQPRRAPSSAATALNQARQMSSALWLQPGSAKPNKTNTQRNKYKAIQVRVGAIDKADVALFNEY